MKCLLISSLFPPDMLGGAEFACAELAKWLAEQGHDVHVLTTAKVPEEQAMGVKRDGLTIWSIYMPRPYSMFAHGQGEGKIKKVLWHLQDHFDPRNISLAKSVLDRVNPDVVNIHCIQGFGYNILGLFAERDVPVVFTLHDLGLACIKMSMFKNGDNCARQELSCRLSSQYKWNLLKKIKRIGFVSPSAALLQRLAEFTPIRESACHVIKYATSFPLRKPAPRLDGLPHFLYVGRIHATKGVRFLLERFAALAASYPFKLTLVGGGGELEKLKSDFAHFNWVHFVGSIPSAEVHPYMLAADALLVPSLWFENSPLVIYEALHCGLPVIGSRIGGIPELVRDGVAGIICGSGNAVEWTSALEDLLKHPQRLAGFRQNIIDLPNELDRNALGRQMLGIYNSVRQK